MLSEVIRYSGSYAKVKAMMGKLLTDEDYKALLAKNTVNDIAAYLKNKTNYAGALKGISESEIHRGQLEEILQEEKEREFVKLFKYENGANKRFFGVFIFRYEIELLKEMLRMLENGILMTFADKTNDYYKKHMSIDTQKLANSQTISQFIENLKGSPYYDILSRFTANQEHLNIFSIEMTLDVYYFGRAWKIIDKLLEKNDKRLVEESFGTEIDILNIMWILRCKKYFDTPKEIIYSFILPKRFKLKRDALVSLVEANGVDEAYEILKKTPYKKVFEKEDVFMEQYYNKFIHSLQKKLSRMAPYSIMTMLSYIHEKDIEINNIIKIIEGIRYKLDMKEIEKYLIIKSGDIDGS